MAKRVKQKSANVAKFGGTEHLGETKLHGHDHDVTTIEATSKTKLQDDTGEGSAAVIRRFTFGMNIQSFKERQPTKQDIFNQHLKGIEIALWKDGLKMMTEVEPRISFDEKNLRYFIFVGARPQKGMLLKHVPQTLSEIAAS